MELKLIEKKVEAGNIKSFIFKPLGKFSWKAGQYLIYFLPHEPKDLRGKMRFFTISSAPFEKNPVITTRILKDSSSFKKSLDQLKIGENVTVKGPDGDFTIENLKNKYVFIAGGVGITPFYSIIKNLRHKKYLVNITLLYFNKDKEILFKSFFDEISNENKNFKVSYIKEPVSKKNLKNLIRGLDKNIFYVSGPDPMVDKTIKIMEELGVKKDRIKDDYFSGYKEI